MTKDKLVNAQTRGVLDCGELSDWYRHNELPRETHYVMPGGPSVTRQEFAAECDVNNIMQQYEKHLADPMRAVREPVYYDFTTMPETLMDAMKVFADAEAAFMTLPATIRREFDNDPAMFADYAADPANVDQMREWELAKPAPVEPAKPAPTEVVIVQGTPPEPAKGS